MRSMGETKLLYALMLSGLGLLLRFTWKTPWILKLSLPLASIFLILNLLRPEAFDKTLMPALQSPFFVPHVVAYIQGYVLVAAGAVWIFFNSKQSDKLVLWGIVFITLGMLMGAFWAKLAWGTYWSWDPKESFALVSWLALIAYLHLRKYYPEQIKFSKFALAMNVLLIFICWFGVNYLPSAKQSVHVYSN
jgi:ABC-type transport system involved in cytochrome c biogenesis permease subunit